MIKGVLKGQKSALLALKSAGLIASICLMFHNISIQIGNETTAKLALGMPSNFLMILSMCWLIAGVVIFIADLSQKNLTSLILLVSCYILATIQAVFVTGFASPFSVYWVLLLVSTFIIVGNSGLLIGSILFTVSNFTGLILYTEIYPDLAITSLIAGVSILVCSLGISLAYAQKSPEKEDCPDSKSVKSASQDKILTIINNFTEAVLSTDENGIITTYNSAALNILDTNANIEGKNISDTILLENLKNEPIDIFNELSKSIAIRQRDDIIMPVGKDDYIRLEATFAPIQSGNKMTPDGYVIILRDITKLKSLEEEKDEFISVVSHELRTPITIAEGSLSNAKILLEKGLKKKIPEAIDESYQQVLFLAKMVNDLSTLSRAERSVGDETEVIDLIELASQINTEYSPQAKEKGLMFNIDVAGNPGKIKVSRLYLHELLQNLITNAIKYTEKGHVTFAIRKKDGLAEFSIKDSGIGIKKSDLGKIFTRFYRAEDYRTRETSGTGLGLYVAAKLARKLGCKIEVDSRLNHGSTFRFSLRLIDK